ncbi:hypothetical protein FGO68_gene3242 [Halteria grandinella]|uniref:Molybdopterin synthase sulfur carrier subunit n=1 Tax=Halteria grandinella TaxID=5974 RepID=A0A8J8N9V5_HALGN|nr:hypothetical protein FGO68_gene3242 [Halteria grandinella]
MASSIRRPVKLLYFASAKEFLGNLPSEDYALDDSIKTGADLIKSVKQRHADNTNFIAILDRSMIAINDEYVYELATVVLKGGEEVAIIPPISGG